jgi:DNA-binding NarL/FixJ family response regulator
LTHLINAQPDLTCCGGAGTLATARRAFAACRPDLVTMDLRLPDGDGVELIREFATAQPATPILVISQYNETVYAERVLKAGARGFVMKECVVEDIIRAIRSVLRGELFVSPNVAALALRQMAGRKTSGPGQSLAVLTNRELQVFQLLGAGIGSRAISVRLNLSIKTVETHRENIKHKLGLPGAAELVHCATSWVENRQAGSGFF